MNKDEQLARQTALQLAMRSGHGEQPANKVTERAEEFRKFLMGETNE